jgi:ATP synthase protein I
MSENEGGTKGGGGSFEERLKSARSRQGLDIPERDPGAASGAREASPLGVGMRVGVELVSALVVAFAIGYGLDRWLHTLPLFLIIFVLLGGVAGVMNVWRLVGPAPRK